MDSIESGSTPDNEETRGLVKGLLERVNPPAAAPVIPNSGMPLDYTNWQGGSGLPTNMVPPIPPEKPLTLGTIPDLLKSGLQSAGQAVGGVLDLADRIRAAGEQTEFGGNSPEAVGNYSSDIKAALPTVEDPESLASNVGGLGGQVALAIPLAATGGVPALAMFFGASGAGQGMNEAALSGASPERKAAFVVGKGILGSFMGGVGPVGSVTRTAVQGLFKRLGTQAGTMLAFDIGDYANRKLTIDPNAQLDPEELVKHALAAVVVGEAAHGVEVVTGGAGEKSEIASKSEEQLAISEPETAAPANTTPNSQDGIAKEANEAVVPEPVSPKPVAEPVKAAEPEPVPEEPKPVEPPPVEPPPAEPIPEPKPVEPEPTQAPVSTPEAAPETKIGIKNAAADAQAAAYGEFKPKRGAKIVVKEEFEKAATTLSEDPTAGKRLVDDLLDNPRPPKTEEQALLAVEAVRLVKERAAAGDAYKADPSESNRKRIIAAREEYQRAMDAATISGGTETAQSFGLRRFMLKEDYSVAELERQQVLRNKGKPVSEEQLKQLQDFHDRYFETLAAKDKAAEDRLRRIEALEAQASEMGQQRNLKPSKFAELDRRADEAMARLKQRLRSPSANIFLDPEVYADLVTVAAKHIAHGVDAGIELVKEFGEGIKPHLDDLLSKAHDTLGNTAQASTLRRIKELERQNTVLEKRIEEHDILARREKQGPQIEEIDELIKERDALNDEIVGMRQKKTKPKELQLTRRIEEVEKQLRENNLKPKSQRQGPDTPEVAALKKRRDDLNKQVQAERSKASGDPEVKRLQKQVDDLNARIAAGDIAPKQKQERATVDTEEIAALKKQRDERREEIERLRKEANPQKSDEERATIAATKRKEASTGNLREKIMYGDFSTKTRRKLLLPKDPVYEKAAAAHEAVKAEYEQAKHEDYLKNRTPAEAARDTLIEIPNAMLAIRSGFDASMLGLQGGLFAAAHPIEAAKLIPDTARAMFNEQHYQEIDARIKARPTAEWDQMSGLDLTGIDTKPTKQEEGFKSILNRFPGVRASNRGFVTYLNLVSATWKHILDRSGGVPLTLDRAKLNANAVNILRGRGAVGKGGFAEAMRVLGKVNWAPRLMVSRFEAAVGGPIAYAAYKRDPVAVKALAKEYARIAAGLAVGNAMLGLFADENEYDPRSTHFLEHRYGKTWVDATAGIANVITFMTRIIGGKTKDSKGALVPIRGKVPYGKPDTTDVIKNFERGKLGPTAGLAVDVLTGKDMTGKPTDYSLDWFAHHTLPLAPLDIYDAIRAEGFSRGAALGIMSLIGLQVNTYEKARR